MAIFLAWTRYLLAVLICAPVLTYNFSRLLLPIFNDGIIDPFFLQLDLAAMVASIALTWGLGSSAAFRTRPQFYFGFAIVFWWLLNIGCYYLFGGGPANWFAMVAAWLVTTTWHFWLAWIGYLPIAWSRRLATLAALFLAQFLFPAMFRVDDIDGDGYVQFQWRFLPPPQKKLEVAETKVEAAPKSRLDLVERRDDFPSFLGPKRTGVVTEPRLAADWTASPPTLVWRRDVGEAFSGFAIVGDLAVTMEQMDKEEAVTARRSSSGELVWSHKTPGFFHGGNTGAGPRATPTIHDGKVYAVGPSGAFMCLALETGKVVWQRDLLADQKGSRPEYGVVASPLIYENLVIVGPTGDKGPSLAAYEAKTGEPKWSGGHRAASYSSPVPWSLGGIKMLLIADVGGLEAVDPLSGTRYWSFDWRKDDGGYRCAQPVLDAGGANQIMMAAYDCGGAVKFTVKPPSSQGGAWSVNEDWKTPVFKTKFATPIAWNGNAYGLDNGIFECVDLSNGKLRWKNGRYRHGQLIMLGELIVVMTEDGELVLVEPSPFELREKGRFRALVGKTWNPMAYARGRLYVRNGQQAACVALPLASEKSVATDKP